MKIGINTFAYRWAFLEKKMDLEAFFEKADSCKLDLVQVCENVGDIISQSSEILGLRKKYRNLEVQLGFTSADRHEIEEMIFLSKEIGSKVLRLVPGSKSRPVKSKEIIDLLESLYPCLESNNVKIGIENHFTFSPKEYRLFVDVLGEYGFSIFDFFNGISRNNDTETVYKALEGKIKQLHVKDVRIERQGVGFLYSGCELGKGILDLKGYVKRIGDDNLELVLEGWIERDRDKEYTIVHEEEINMKSIEYLRRINEQ